MPYRANYPATVNEVLDDTMTFKPEALAAVRIFAHARPYRQPVAKRKRLVRTLCRHLSRVYGLNTPQVVFRWTDGCSGGSYYQPAGNVIVLTGNVIVLAGRFSVVTFLHEFAHARGADEQQACRWSINLFRKCFPRSFARCRWVGHTLRARD
jgi:hypothetical protein